MMFPKIQPFQEAKKLHLQVNHFHQARLIPEMGFIVNEHLRDNRFDKLYFFSAANLMNPVMVMQQPQEFDPYINARAASYQGSQYGSRYNNTEIS